MELKMLKLWAEVPHTRTCDCEGVVRKTCYVLGLCVCVCEMM